MACVTESDRSQVTVLLKAWRGGDPSALERLTPLLYDELKRLARRFMQQERAGHTLQATALVNEAYLRLVDLTAVEWQDRSHFMAVAAQTMRRVLIDAARARGAEKRGGGLVRADRSADVDLDGMPSPGTTRALELCALDDALDALARMDPRRARVIELRFFGGLTVEETADVLEISPQSVLRDWKLARAWLTRELGGTVERIGRARVVDMMVPRLHPSPTEELMSARRIIGLTLVTLGMVILLWGGLFWTDRDTIVNTGALEVQTKERRGVALPPIVGGVVLVSGIILALIPSRRRSIS